MIERIKEIWLFVSALFERMDKIHMSLIAAGVAFYAMFALAPMLVLAIAAATGAAYQEEPAQRPAAAETSGFDDGEIVVTARKSNERIQDVPVSLTAVTADALLPLVDRFGGARLVGAGHSMGGYVLSRLAA